MLLLSQLPLFLSGTTINAFAPSAVAFSQEERRELLLPPLFQCSILKVHFQPYCFEQAAIICLENFIVHEILEVS